jgi:hypothetical protein
MEEQQQQQQPRAAKVSANAPEKKTALNTSYIVMKKVEVYVIGKDNNRQRICVEYPLSLSDDDMMDILQGQSSDYLYLDGVAPGYVAKIKIWQRFT